MSQMRLTCVLLLLVAASAIVATIFIRITPFRQAIGTVHSEPSVYQVLGLLWRQGNQPSLIGEETIWSGGLLGNVISLSLQMLAGPTGAYIFLIAMILALFVLIFNISFSRYLNKTASALGQTATRVDAALKSGVSAISEKREARRLARERALEEKRAREIELQRLVEAEAAALQQRKDEAAAQASIAEEAHPGNAPEHALPDDEANASYFSYPDDPLQHLSYDLPHGDWRTNAPYQWRGSYTGSEHDADPFIPGRDRAQTVRADDYRIRPSRWRDGSTHDGLLKDSHAADGSTDHAWLDELLDGAEDTAPDRAVIPEGIPHDEFGTGREHWDADEPKKKKKRSKVIGTGEQLSLLSEYRRPPIHYLFSGKDSATSARAHEQIQALGQKLEDTLKSFGVDAKVVNYVTGPTITF